MQRQAVPLVKPEKPLVGTGMESAVSKYTGSVMIAENNGTIEYVSADEIKIKDNLGKGKVSKIRIEYTPIGEKIIISTHKPGLVIGRKGEKIQELTRFFKK